MHPIHPSLKQFEILFGFFIDTFSEDGSDAAAKIDIEVVESIKTLSEFNSDCIYVIKLRSSDLVNIKDEVVWVYVLIAYILWIFTLKQNLWCLLRRLFMS